MNSNIDTPEPIIEADDALSEIGLIRIGDVVPGDNPQKIAERKRAFFRREKSRFSQLNLIRGVDGVLRWQEGAARTGYQSGRRYGRAAVPAGRVEKQYIFEKLHDPNQISSTVEALDDIRGARVALRNLGYRPGVDVDDIVNDELTREALKAFQRNNGLSATGDLDADTINALEAAQTGL